MSESTGIWVMHCEVYSRVCGYYRPVQCYNVGKLQEFKDRTNFVVKPKEK